MDGNFSVQVLRRALSNLHLQLYQMGSEDVKEAQSHPEKETGFICNLRAHWFAIRRIGGHWYDLNSLSGLPETDAIPNTISDFYLRRINKMSRTLARAGFGLYSLFEYMSSI